MTKVLNVLIGSGGHAIVVIDALIKSGHAIDMVLDNSPQKQGTLSTIGNIIQKIPLDEWWNSNPTKSIIALGSNYVRKKIAESLTTTKWLHAIHPTALVHESAIVGKGVYIGANAIIQPNVIIGNHTIINTGAIVEHECSIGEYCHISPGSILTGNVHIEEGVFIGARTVVIPNKQIGKWSIIGAGSVVVKEIPSYKKAFGAPCRIVGSIEGIEED